MDFGILNLAIFAAATFLAAFVTGVSGFAFGLIAAGIWLPGFLSSDCRRWPADSGWV